MVKLQYEEHSHWERAWRKGVRWAALVRECFLEEEVPKLGVDG